MKKIKYLVLILMILVFLSGLGVLLYPYIRGYFVDRQIERTAEEFLSRVETDPISPYPSESQLDQDTPSDPPAPTEPNAYTDLWRDILGLRLYGEPKVGDIIIFEKDGVLLVKRIAACPGDPVDLSQLEYMTSIPIPVWEEAVLTVPEGCYFVLGDNAQNSWDSRYWAQPYVFRQQIVAKLIGIA